MAQAVGARRRVLLCEGQADGAVFECLILDRRLPPFHVTWPRKEEDIPTTTYGKGGFRSFLQGMPAATSYRDTTALLVVGDADNNPDKSFRELRGQIPAEDGYGVPDHPREATRGSNGIAVAVLMVPWDDEPGCIESVCLQAMYDRWPEERACLETFSDCMRTNGWQNICHRDKMRLRALFCSICEDDPYWGLAQAWNTRNRARNLVPLNHNAFNRIAELLRDFGAVAGES